MDLRKLKKLIDLVEESGIAELEVTEGEEKVRIVKQPASTPHAAYMMPATAPMALAAAMEAPGAIVEKRPGLSAAQVVKSPLVGTFYRSAGPDAEPFVEIGSVVKPGDTLCVLEAMHVHNKVESEFSGTVSAILVENGQPAEYGEPLFIID